MANRLPTLRKFLDNPSYIDKGVYGTWWKDKYVYERRWELIQQVYKTFELTYLFENESSYWVHVAVPSELKGVYYDIVIHFMAPNESVLNEPNLEHYEMQIFSNNPVFGWHFAHANVKHGLVIPELITKIPEEMVATRAEKYNPKDNVGYDHSFYHAGKYLLKAARYLHKGYIKSVAAQFDGKLLLKLVGDMQTKNKERFNKKEDIKQRISGGIDDMKANAHAKAYDIGEKIKNTKDKVLQTLHIPDSDKGDKKKKTGVHYTKPRRGTKTKISGSIHRIRPHK